MVDDIKKDLSQVKAGVEGQVADIPPAPEIPAAPQGPPAAPETPAMPEAPPAPSTSMPDAVNTITESSGGYQDISPSEEAPSADMRQQQSFSMPQQMNAPSNSSYGIDADKVHEIIEQVVSEKWDDMISKVGDIGSWKQKVEMNIVGTKQEIVRLTGRLENIQNSVLGKVQDYDKGIKGVHTELKALERVLERIMEPLVTNVKELQEVTESLKRYKK